MSGINTIVEPKINYKLILFSVITSLLIIMNYSNTYGINLSIAIALFGLILFYFILKTGKGLPIKEITLIIFCLQFILGPFWAYYFFDPHITYDMKVSDKVYFAYALPAILFLGLGLYIVPDKSKILKIIQKKLHEEDLNYYQTGKKLIFVSIVLPFLSLFLPILGFAFFLCSTLNFIGVYYILFSHQSSSKKYKWYLLGFGIALINSINAGMFHELFIWSVFSILFFSLKVNIKFSQKILLLSVAIFFAMGMEFIKLDYRESTWQDNKNISLIESLNLYTDLFKNILVDPTTLFSPEYLESKLVRINIGNITSRVMDYVPFYEPYANGETIIKAIETSLVPRFFNPERISSGGKENYIRFTGYDIKEDTSISIGILGEAYANFGAFGGVIFMFFWGLFISISLNLFYKLIVKRPELFFWIPFIFSQSIKAEIDVVHVLNYMTKSAILTFFIFYFFLRKKHEVKSLSFDNIP